MFLLRIKLGFIVLFLAVFCASTMALPTSTRTDAAVRLIADQLVATQATSGDYAGAWLAKSGVSSGAFTGTMAAGLVDAYAMTYDPAYKTAADLAGNFIRDNAPGCSLYYDEAYAFMLLSQIDCTPDSNQWRTALEDFYLCLEAQQPADPDYYGGKAGTELFVAQIEEGLIPPYATFEVAYYTVAAYYVNASQKTTWRSELIRLLQTSNADSGEQVFALGAATWALSQIGALDSTPGTIYVGSPDWGVQAEEVSQLPQLLASYQIPVLWENEYHFYSIYSPPSAEFSGWTETNIYAVMGLDAADKSSTLYNYRTKIDHAWAVNMQPVDSIGDVWYDAISAPGTGDNISCYHYAGEYLQYLAAARLPGDLDLNDTVNVTDLMLLAEKWLKTGCDCGVADLNRDRKVDLQDLNVLSQGWLLSR